ncbi:polysaccharide pyruvyl transferase family protein [Halocynthiibacter namhaensis]|uniref:polysaccharide pyruvyl transferase family protein n=1 Tax=Halocynthiibacter namhaensis TaxID=1290553 RepID=UPI00138E402B|nr:polysaccharide pyruvyl transferase family protein [Halocynthiibacter namhaensis]
MVEKHLQETEMIGRLMTQTNTDYISGLQHQLNEVIASTCRGMTSYALVDFPDHSNVGDSAIYLGELKLLREILQRDPAFVSKAKNHVDDINKFGAVNAVFLHGGGNFGDVWPAHQQFRERIIARYPDHKIVQLPQTLFFKDPAALKRSAEVIARHPNFTLLVRDQRSYNIAYDAFDCEVKLCPDSAMSLGALPKVGTVTHPRLAMLRQDKETQLEAGDILKMAGDCPVEDWVEEERFKPIHEVLLDKVMPILGPLRWKTMPTLSVQYESWASTRVNRGLAQLSTADFIVTDRLHVHILSSLLGIEHVVLDNNYGKISEYIKQWGKPDNAIVVSSVEELKTLLPA